MKISANPSDSSAAEIRRALDSARLAANDWRREPVRKRAAAAKKFANLLADDYQSFCDALDHPERRDDRESLSAEILPLASAAHFLGRRAVQILAPRYPRRSDRPFWLGRIQSSVRHEPWGLILIIGTWNYPLFLTGVQLLQALVAGNAVVIKPAEGSAAITARLVETCVAAGFPSSLIVTTDCDVSAAASVIRCGVDKVVLTGSSQTGRAVARSLADGPTPSIMELSGCDSVIVLPDANLERVVRGLAFGTALTSGATCMAPRRVIVVGDIWNVFYRLLEQRMQRSAKERFLVRTSTFKLLQPLIENAIESGARFLHADMQTQFEQAAAAVHAPDESGIKLTMELAALVLVDVHPSMNIAQSDFFAPLFVVMRAARDSDAIDIDQLCPYALTSSIFGSVLRCETVAREIEAGCVVINDLIAPTADPRVPFGGWKASGFGVTRGNEGLLEMTRPRTVVKRRGNWLPHLDRVEPTDAQLLAGLLQCSYAATWKQRIRGMAKIWSAIRNRKKPSGQSETDVD